MRTGTLSNLMSAPQFGLVSSGVEGFGDLEMVTCIWGPHFSTSSFLTKSNKVEKCQDLLGRMEYIAAKTLTNCVSDVRTDGRRFNKGRHWQ